MTWDEECDLHIEKTLADRCTHGALLFAIEGLIEAKIAEAMFNAKLIGNPGQDPIMVVYYNKKLLSSAISKFTEEAGGAGVR